MSLSKSSNELIIPNGPITAERGPASKLCDENGINSFHEAIAFVGGLPYGRNTDRADYMLILKEKRGTCSTKHAFLAVLAHELSLTIDLVIGIYEMTELNTPGAGAVLTRYNLKAIPEAHCYLRSANYRFDITRSSTPKDPSVHFFAEQTIVPQQIGDFKTEFHRRHLADWLDRKNINRRFSLQSAWEIREECIAALGKLREPVSGL